ncbi:MAG: cytochrome c3 family protein [Deltaproteobacteria bacterium]|nr:cytochrome c3 family protein [Deltaproteobacteria bacterium]
MSKRFLTILTVVLSGVIFLAAGVLVAADKQEVPDEVILQNKGYKKDKKGPVKLTHKKHHADYKVACAECHHVYEGGKNVWKEGDHVDKCSKCHDPKKKNKKTKAMKLQNAYHKNCKNCHKALKKEGKPTGPFKKCNQCHAKKKKK